MNIKKYIKVAVLLAILIIILFLNIKVIMFMDKMSLEEEYLQKNYEKPVNIKGISEENFDENPGDLIYFLPSLIESSSETKGYGNNSYSAENTIDGSPSSAWIAGRKKDGEEDYLYIEFEDKVLLSGIEFLNGYCKSQEIYKKNSRIGRVEIEVDNKYRIAAELEDKFKTYQKISFGKNIEVEKMTIIIRERVKGSQQDNPALSELRFFKYEQ